jgi:membrane protein YqaA with SNARE-associated domain
MESPLLPEPAKPGFLKRQLDKATSLFQNRVAQIVTLVLVVITSVLIVLFGEKLAYLHTLGYVGAFFISLIGSASLVVPVPGWIMIAVLGKTLNPLLVGLIATVGGTLGEMTGYGLGYGGRIVLEKLPRYEKIMGWMRKWGSPTIFVMALIPNPLFDVAGAAAGTMRFPIWKFLLWGGLGRLPKTMLYAYTGIWFTDFIKFGLS